MPTYFEKIPTYLVWYTIYHHSPFIHQLAGNSSIYGPYKSQLWGKGDASLSPAISGT
jgi:hypothetical protein